MQDEDAPLLSFTGTIQSVSEGDLASPVPLRTPRSSGGLGSITMTTMGPSPRTLAGSPGPRLSSTLSHRHRTWSPAETTSQAPRSRSTTPAWEPSPSSEALEFECSPHLHVHPDCLDRYLDGKRGCATCSGHLKDAHSSDGVQGMCRFLVEVLTRFAVERTRVIAALKMVRGRVLAGPPTCREWLKEEGLCTLLLGLFRSFSGDAQVAAQLCETVTVLTTDCGGTSEALHQLGVCEELCGALILALKMRRVTGAQGGEGMCVVALQACANLAWRSPAGQAALLQHNGALLVVEAMTQFQSVDVLLEACGVVADACYRNAQSQAAFGGAGACTHVCRALASSLSSSQEPEARHLQLRALQALANLAFMHRENQLSLAQKGAAVVLSDVLLSAMDDRDVQCEGCRAIDNLSWGCVENQRALGSGGGAAVVANVLSAFGQHKVAVLQGCRAAATLAASHSGNQTILAGLGVCHAIVEGLRGFAGDRNVICECCDALVALLHHHEANQRLVAHAGAAAVVCEAMARFAGERDVQLRGARVLANLSNPANPGAPSFPPLEHSGDTEQLANAGACEVLCEALRAFGDDRNLVVYACRALVGLCATPRGAERVAAAGGALQVLKTSRRFAADRDVQWYGLGALANLCQCQPSSAALLGPEAMAHVCGVLPRHVSTSDRHVTLQCLAALAHLLKPGGANLQAAMDHQAGSHVLAALDKFREDSGLCCHALSLLESLALQSASIATALALGHRGLLRVGQVLHRYGEQREVALACLRALVGLTWPRAGHKPPTSPATPTPDELASLASSVVEAAELHMPADPEAAQWALEALGGLAAFGQRPMQDALREAGAVQAVLGCMRDFPATPLVLAEGLRALAQLCHHSHVTQSLAARERAARVVVDVLRRYHSDAAVAVHGLRAMHSLAHHSREHQEALRVEGAPAVLAEILKSHVGERFVVMEACRAVARLAWRCPEGQEGLSRAGVVGALMAGLRLHSHEHGVQLQGCRALSALAHRSPTCQSELGGLGACEWVAGLASGLPDSDQEMGLEATEAMAHLAFRHSDNQTRLGSSSDVATWLVAALQCHPPPHSHDTPLMMGLAGSHSVSSSHSSHAHDHVRGRVLASLDALASLCQSSTAPVLYAVQAPLAVSRLLRGSDGGDKELVMASLRAVASLAHVTLDPPHHVQVPGLASESESHAGMSLNPGGDVLRDPGLVEVAAECMLRHAEDRLMQLDGSDALLTCLATTPSAREALLAPSSRVVPALCGAMHRFPMDARLASRGVRLLSLLPYGDEGQQGRVGGEWIACQCLTLALANFIADRVVVGHALCAMAALSQNHVGNQERLSEAIPSVLAALEAFSRTMTCSGAHGTTLVANLCMQHSGNAGRFGVPGCQLTLRTLGTHAAHPPAWAPGLALQCLRALSALCRVSENHAALLGLDACGQLCGALGRHTSDVHVATYAARTVEHLCVSGDGARAAALLSQARVLPLLARLLACHVADRDAAVQGCRALVALGAWPRPSGAKAPSAPLTADLGPALAAALQAHRGDRSVVLMVLEALVVLARQSREAASTLLQGEDPTSAPLATQLHALLAQASADDGGVTAKCLRALAGLASRNALAQRTLLSAGLLPCCVALIRSPIVTHDVTLTGLRALTSLVEGSGDAQAELLGLHGEALALQAIADHQAQPDLLCRALQLTAALVRGNAIAAAAVLKGGLYDTIGRLLCEHPHDRVPVLEALRLLVLLAVEPSSPSPSPSPTPAPALRQLRSHGACVDGIVAVLRAQRDDADVQGCGCELLFHLTLDASALAAARLSGSPDAAAALVATATRHVGSADLQPFVLGTIANLARASEVARQALRQASVGDAIVRVLGAHASDAAVACCACRALSTLCLGQAGHSTGLLPTAPVTRLLCRALADFAAHRDLQVCGWEALARLHRYESSAAVPAEVVDELRQGGVARLLCEALRRWGYPEVQVTLEALEAASSLLPLLPAELGGAGIAAAILHVVEEASAVEGDGGREVVRQGLRALLKLSACGGPVAERGGGRVLLHCLRHSEARHEGEKGTLNLALEVSVAWLAGIFTIEEGATSLSPTEAVGVVGGFAPLLCGVVRRREGGWGSVRLALEGMGTLLRQCAGMAQDALGSRDGIAALCALLAECQDGEGPPVPVEVMGRAVEVVGLLAAEHEDNREALGKAGAGASIVRLLHLQALPPSGTPVTLRTDLLRAAIELAREDAQFQDVLHEAGVVEHVLGLMRAEAQTPRVQALGCWAVVVLCDDHVMHRQAFTAAGAASVVRLALGRFEGDEGVQTAGVQALRVLGWDRASAVGPTCQADSQGLLLGALGVLPLGENSPHVVACLKLMGQWADILRTTPASASQGPCVPSLSAIEAVLRQLSAFPFNAKVQRAGMAALASLLHACFTSSSSSMPAQNGEGGVAIGRSALSLLLQPSTNLAETLKQALSHFPKDASLACHVATLLNTLAVAGRDSGLVYPWLTEEGLLSITCSLMRKWGRSHPSTLPMLYSLIAVCAASDATCQRRLGAGCGALVAGEGELAWERGAQDLVLRCRALSSLAADCVENQDAMGPACGPLVHCVLMDARSDERTRAKAIEAAAHLCHHHSANQAALLHAGVLVGLERAMRAFPTSLALQLQAVGLLRNLLWQAEAGVGEAVGEAGLVEATCDAMWAYGDGMGLYGLAALSALSTACHAARDRLMACGGAALLLPRDLGSVVLLQASYVLRGVAALAGHSPAAQAQLLAEGAGDYALSVLTGTGHGEREGEEAEVAALALRALMELHRGAAQAQARLVRDGGACEAIVKTLRHFADDRRVQRCGWEALVLLARAQGGNKRRFVEAGVLSLIEAAFERPRSAVGDLKRLAKIGGWLDATFDCSAAMLSRSQSIGAEEGWSDDDASVGSTGSTGLMGLTMGPTARAMAETMSLSHAAAAGGGKGLLGDTLSPSQAASAAGEDEA